MRLTRFLFTVATSGALVLGTSVPALADIAVTDQNSDDAVSVVESVVPDIAAETSETHEVSVSEDAESVAVVVEESELIPDGVSFSVDYATGSTPASEGMSVLETDHSGVQAVVQPTVFGVRVLTTIASSDAPSSYAYTFDVPEGTDLVQSELNYYLEAGDDVLGQIQFPWAVDADGVQVPTSYSWEDGVLTQHVDLTDPAITYPVVADPAWGYTYSYTVNKTAAVNKSRLKSCFNCYFPVSGAPRAFPTPGKLLPLTVGPANFECKFKSEFSGTNYFGFQFDATKNHVDGLGSNIVFEFRTVGGVKKLVVSAYIVNDSFWANNPAYRLGAQNNWAKFAWNLNNTTIIT